MVVVAFVDTEEELLVEVVVLRIKVVVEVEH